MSDPCPRCSQYDRATVEHLELVATLREMVIFEAKKLLESSAAMNANPYLKPADVAKLTTAVVTLDRLIRGESTTAVDVKSQGFDLSKFTNEELEQFLFLSEKAATQ